MALVTGGTLSLLLLLLRRHWALLFADESEKAIIDLVTQLMPSLVVSQLGIGLIAVLAGEGENGCRDIFFFLFGLYRVYLGFFGNLFWVFFLDAFLGMTCDMVAVV